MTINRSLTRGALAAVSSALAATLLLSACGGGHGEDSGNKDHSKDHGKDHGGGHGSDGGGKGGEADVTFAQGMIPHHRQALDMARLAPSRASSARVKKLAEDIEGAQEPEIRTMSGWLKAWGEKVPGPSSDSGHSDHSGHSMPGMMTSEDMERLKDGSGEKFDREFLKMMIEHHEGAVTMARTEESKGSYGPAKEMARDIRRSQTQEIATMRGLLKK